MLFQIKCTFLCICNFLIFFPEGQIDIFAQELLDEGDICVAAALVNS